MHHGITYHLHRGWFAEQINRYVLALEKDRGLAEKEAGGTEIDQAAPEKSPQRRAGRAR